MEQKGMDIDTDIIERLASCQKVLVGLGAEWKAKGLRDGVSGRQQLLSAYEVLYKLIKDKDYFIVTMATDALIYESSLGSRTEMAVDADRRAEEEASCPSADEKTLALMDKIFPVPQKPGDTRWQRIVAPCGNETWRQCSAACTKDIWEPGEIPEDICPHCGASLTGNTMEADVYIEEGYLPQWNRYTRWLTDTLGKELVILELGVGFANPGVIRFPFEKTAFFNQRSFMYRVNEKFPQITRELSGRAVGIGENSVKWVEKLCPESGRR
ncbi:hypothetical protein [Clostridium sp. AN503]|uniref:hypothetical protein n=1 Tax=Clostridium sp. AN503 TaxID=3160598 RepID=UPI00345AA441